MVFENFENIVSLFCTIVGLLYCVFKYVESHQRGYKFVVGFFLANFLSEYYWTIYELITHSYPEVSEFIAYLGWNVGFLCLLFAAFFIRSDGSKRFFHPLILIPIVINIPQLVLYCSFGGIVNNIWEVGITTATEVFCLQELIYYFKNKGKFKQFPLFSLLTIVFLLCSYGQWTSSCFDWPSEILNPYLYFSIIGSVTVIFLVYAAKKHYSSIEAKIGRKSTSELRYQVLTQAIATIIIIVGCGVGFITAIAIKNSLSDDNNIFQKQEQIATYLFIISIIMILLIIILLYFLSKRYRHIIDMKTKVDDKKRVRWNFISTIIVTFVLMASAAVYNNVVLYKASVVSMYEAGDDATETTSVELENYLTVAVSTLRVTADSVDLMIANGQTQDEILNYLVAQTNKQFEQFDENFTGLYALVNGEYMDGTFWVPEAGYEPTERDWYKGAVEAKGEVVIVSPYVDAQTGSIVVSIAKRLTDPTPDDDTQPKNIVCLDVIVNYIDEVTKEVDIAGKGYGMVINSDGFIVAHHDDEFNGQNIIDIYGEDVLNSITSAKKGRLSIKMNDQDCTLFICPVMDQWYALTIIENFELFEETYLQLAVSIIVFLVSFGLIAFFYYLGYKNEQIYGQKVEEMNIQVVTALAAAIDAKDNYTNGHSSRVAEYARMIAAHCGYSKTDQDEIYMAGLLHDVGKIGVPDEVINKQAKLTDEEFALIKKHPVIGESILGSIKERPMLAVGARWHHERYDGTGYPDGLTGENIPEAARIIAVADAYDAMTSKRSYRDMLPREKVIDEIKNGSGTQFDPRFAAAMLDLIAEDTDYLMRENPEKKDIE